MNAAEFYRTYDVRWCSTPLGAFAWLGQFVQLLEAARRAQACVTFGNVGALNLDDWRAYDVMWHVVVGILGPGASAADVTNELRRRLETS